MGPIFLVLIPFVAVVVDYSMWIEACFIKGVFLDQDANWQRPISSYFRLGGVIVRNALLMGTMVLAWFGSQSHDDSIMLLITMMALGVYFGFAIWSFRRNLENHWADRRPT